MDISGISDLFGHSVYDPQVQAMLAYCKATHDKNHRIDRYGSINSEPLGVEFWFWWKGYYRDQIGEPRGTVEPDGSSEVVLYELRLTPEGLAGVTLPFGLTFPAGDRHRDDGAEAV